jgi:hypothetical protein
MIVDARMKWKLSQLRARVAEIEGLADKMSDLGKRLAAGEKVQPELSIVGQQWYRAARELLFQNNFSGLHEFENCYVQPEKLAIEYYIKQVALAPNFAHANLCDFEEMLQQARALVLALEQELLSRELPIVTELSFELVADEFDKAQSLLDQSGNDEILWRVAGVLARVALERHLFTVVDSRKVRIVVNPPTKKKPEVEDVIQTLVKEGVLTAVQRAYLNGLMAVANNCAHPKEPVKRDDVERLIKDAKAAAATIV